MSGMCSISANSTSPCSVKLLAASSVSMPCLMATASTGQGILSRFGQAEQPWQSLHVQTSSQAKFFVFHGGVAAESVSVEQ